MNSFYLADRLPEQLPDDPMHWALAWLTHAEEQAVRRNANAMAIVTCGKNAKPAARMVLCKHFLANPGYLVFYTNYKSDKARQIQENPNVAVLFHWDQIGRQVRIEGQAVRSPEAESDAYFATRDWGSQIGAWGSDQSTPLESRKALLAQVSKRALKLGVNVAKNLGSIIGSDHPAIPRPPHWGGFRVWASQVELWIEGKDRIHDRARWQRTLQRQGDHGFVVGEWSGTRLQP
ncbi:MAG: pyridoxamine 5'-phosphate oxidase [Gammaproteobacteria bacterium]|nr:pyridoxamine 5'-phosphate oxidase [Gammaproteobacteria bacterium]MDH5305503.1 pyridoxamine 5'-phosphate oxidase [Gammaproteobacteria bacterium]MDH5322444.1 pyridoxamine 5'-phosphate oxidase [Gammaproteobacteria bacterium]